MPDSVSPFHASHGGSPGDAYCTGMFARDACGSHTRGVHDQRRPMYATPGGAPASLRWNGRKSHPPSAFFASTCQMWFPFDLDFLPSSLKREM